VPASKWQVKGGQRVFVVGLPPGVALDLGAVAPQVTDPADADVVIAFVLGHADLEVAAPAVEAAREDRLAWVAYPKAGQLGTDLNRDTLNDALQEHGVQAVRQISVDATWSALRFRPVS
jgi:hypothetical protein